VIALNEGRSIRSVLDRVYVPPGCPPSESRLDLRGIDFSHQNLRGPWKLADDERKRIGVHLEEADLTGANLSWAILPRANLRGALLRHADLDHAELIYSDLSGADLDGASLEGAWLLYTKFHDTNITTEQLESRQNLGQMDFDYHAYER
jgi:uncharacterized protein YjbI with pentapeptide repeats